MKLLNRLSAEQREGIEVLVVAGGLFLILVLSLITLFRFGMVEMPEVAEKVDIADDRK